MLKIRKDYFSKYKYFYLTNLKYMKNLGFIVTAVFIVSFVAFIIFRVKLKSSGTKVSGNERCIITIQGNKYDVTDFRKIHPGGDIFVCGSDMTETFVNQHGMDLKRIEKYRVK